MSNNSKNGWKSIKVANNDRESLYIFWTTWGISMKFSGTMCLMIMLKVIKKQGFTLSLEDSFLKKPQRGGQIDPPSLFKVKLQTVYTIFHNRPFTLNSNLKLKKSEGKTKTNSTVSNEQEVSF